MRIIVRESREYLDSSEVSRTLTIRDGGESRAGLLIASGRRREWPREIDDEQCSEQGQEMLPPPQGCSMTASVI